MRSIVILLFLSEITFGLINGVLSIPIIKSPYQRLPSVYDDNGCCLSCGYTWCEDIQECVRPWETYCKNLENKI